MSWGELLMPNIRARCDGCCSLDTSCCEACARCTPRWFCALVEVAPKSTGTGTGSGSGGSVPPYCCKFKFRLNRTSCNLWSGSGSCGSPSAVFLDLELELVHSQPATGTGDSCSTKITSTLLEEPVYFEGVFPNGMEFDVETDDFILSVTLSRSNLIENPLITEQCSPCTCATCIPEKLMVSIRGQDGTFCGCFDKKIYVWDCASRGWIGDPLICRDKTYTPTIRIPPVTDNVCGVYITGSITGGVTPISVTDTVFFEGGPHPRWYKGIPCSGNGASSTWGDPLVKPCPESDPDCDPPTTQSYSTFFSHTIIVGTDYQITIEEYVCDGDFIFSNCCGCVEIPRNLLLSISSSNCPDLDGYEVNLSYDTCGAIWRGYGYRVGSGCSTTLLVFSLTCAFRIDTQAYSWSLIITNAGVPIPIGSQYPDVQSVCDPIELEWNNRQGSIACACPGLPPGGPVMDILVLAA